MFDMQSQRKFKSLQIRAENYEKLCRLKDVLQYRSMDNVIEFLINDQEFRVKGLR